MPDITIPCPECGREYRLSEYATVDGISCLTCGATLQKPKHCQGTGGLKLKSLQEYLPPPLPAPAGPALATAGVAPAAIVESTDHPVPHMDIHKEEPTRETPKWPSLVVAAAVLAALVGFQYFADRLDAYYVAYEWSRNLLIVGSYLMVVVVAFQDGLGPGALCLVIPPYTVFYATASVESAVIRGLFYGTVLALVAEVYFLPETSLAMVSGTVFSELVSWVDGLIVTASKPPI